MLIKAILFDCDGTLIDSEEAHFLAWQQALLSQKVHLDDAKFSLFTGKPDSAVAKVLTEWVGRDCTSLLAQKRHFYQELLHKGLPPIQATVDFVKRLATEKKRLGIQLGVASAALKTEVISNLKHLEIENLFDLIISGHDDLHHYNDPEGVNKPKPYIYLHSAKLLNLSPQQCVVIEDSHTGVTAAQEAGCLTIAIPNQHTLQHDLSKATFTIETFAHIGVDHFIEMLTQVKKVQS